VGSSGIKRRKPKRELPDEPDLPDLTPGDQRRLFGNFTWGGYSPAGALERNGFFWRQVARGRRMRGWRRGVGYALSAVVALFLVLYVIQLVISAF
jgi:hypothetical protein